MPRLTDILIFLFINALGFFSASICYHIGSYVDRLPLQDNGTVDAYRIKQFFFAVTVTWMICAVFSLCSFFFKGNARLTFLLAPLVMPMAYGLKLLFLA